MKLTKESTVVQSMSLFGESESNVKFNQIINWSPLLTFIYFVTLSVFGLTFYAHRSALSLPIPLNLKAENDISLAIYNEYSTLNYTLFPYPFLADALLLEPYRNSTLVLAEPIISSCDYTWSMTGDGSLSEESFEGAFNSHDLSSSIFARKTGRYEIVVESHCGDNDYQVFVKTVYVKYVRRELLSLTQEDREEFLDAMYIAWTLNTKKGISRYYICDLLTQCSNATVST
jgi:hypothetical protein